MNKTFTAVIKNVDSWWIGWIEEIPGVNCQEKTKEKLFDSLRVTLKESLEINRQESLIAAGSNYYEETISLSI